MVGMGGASTTDRSLKGAIFSKCSSAVKQLYRTHIISSIQLVLFFHFSTTQVVFVSFCDEL